MDSSDDVSLVALLRNSGSKMRDTLEWEEPNYSAPKSRTSRFSISATLPLILCVSVIVNIGYAIAYHNVVSAIDSRADLDPGAFPRLYSPAQEAVRYKLSAHREHTEFQGPRTPHNDKLWHDLYAHFNVYATEEEARLLPNKTAPAAKGNFYPIVLNVFHELHCLDAIRKVFYYFLDPQWNTTHNPYEIHNGDIYAALMQFGGSTRGILHLDHCIDTIRQTMVCNADITPLVVQWSEELQEFRSRATVLHECRDFDKIVEWADKRAYGLPLGGWGDGPELGKCAYNDSADCLRN